MGQARVRFTHDLEVFCYLNNFECHLKNVSKAGFSELAKVNGAIVEGAEYNVVCLRVIVSLKVRTYS